MSFLLLKKSSASARSSGRRTLNSFHDQQHGRANIHNTINNPVTPNEQKSKHHVLGNSHHGAFSIQNSKNGGTPLHEDESGQVQLQQQRLRSDSTNILQQKRVDAFTANARQQHQQQHETVQSTREQTFTHQNEVISMDEGRAFILIIYQVVIAVFPSQSDTYLLTLLFCSSTY